MKNEKSNFKWKPLLGSLSRLTVSRWVSTINMSSIFARCGFNIFCIHATCAAPFYVWHINRYQTYANANVRVGGWMCLSVCLSVCAVHILFAIEMQISLNFSANILCTYPWLRVLCSILSTITIDYVCLAFVRADTHHSHIEWVRERERDSAGARFFKFFFSDYFLAGGEMFWFAEEMGSVCVCELNCQHIFARRTLSPVFT